MNFFARIFGKSPDEGLAWKIEQLIEAQGELPIEAYLDENEYFKRISTYIDNAEEDIYMYGFDRLFVDDLYTRDSLSRALARKVKLHAAVPGKYISVLNDVLRCTNIELNDVEISEIKDYSNGFMYCPGKEDYVLLVWDSNRKNPANKNQIWRASYELATIGVFMALGLIEQKFS